MEYGFHLGGMSALYLRGYTHYVRLGGGFDLYLFGSDIPSWLGKLEMDARVLHRKSALFGEDTVGIENSRFWFTETPGAELEQSPWQWPMRASTAERAILEALDELPKSESFHMVDVAFESLTGLRPQLLTTLLTKCRSVKVKRLFFVYADRHLHTWRKYIDTSKIEMGRGDRALAPGGRLHPTYRITVPPDLMPMDTSDAAP
ncbi:MAG: type IV toxin-antitoxin system AbiEi family antitoxin [Alphaproteobacteria bacterium]|nr:type IV toxin-antitoxin system AbiEi family antitoxin [Alphaproteobacteria bacterium]